MNPSVRFLARAALIAALYAMLTYLSACFGLSGGVIQVRLSEALTVLPVFTPAAIPGLFVGCLLGNLLTGAAPWDILFGSLATLLGGAGTYLLRRHPALSPLPPILANALIVPVILQRVYGVTALYPLLLLAVLAGEAISAGLLGTLLTRSLQKRPGLFR